MSQPYGSLVTQLGGLETLEVRPIGPNGFPSAITELTNTNAIANLAASLVQTDNFPLSTTQMNALTTTSIAAMQTTTLQSLTTALETVTPNFIYSADAGTQAHTLSAAGVAGGNIATYLALTAVTSSANMTMPAAASWVPAIPGAAVNSAYVLRVLNESTFANTVTLQPGLGVTMTGTMTVPGGTGAMSHRDLLVTVASLSPAIVTVQDVGASGTVQ